MGVESFIKNLENSPLRRRGMEYDLYMDEFLCGIMRYIDRPLAVRVYNLEIGTCYLYDSFYDNIAKFQRNNDKWSDEMQSSYVSNLFAGYTVSPILLYKIGNNTSDSKCKVLDGLQRCTAILRFLRDDTMKIHDSNGTYITSGDLRKYDNYDRFIGRIKQTISVMCFNNEIEVVEYYIAMNENITHSTDDIQRAKDYLDKLRGI